MRLSVRPLSQATCTWNSLKLCSLLSPSTVPRAPVSMGHGSPCMATHSMRWPGLGTTLMFICDLLLNGSPGSCSAGNWTGRKSEAWTHHASCGRRDCCIPFQLLHETCCAPCCYVYSIAAVLFLSTTVTSCYIWSGSTILAKVLSANDYTFRGLSPILLL